jgi:hypothetical protein
MGWRFRDKTPLWFSALVGLLVADSALHVGLLMTVSSWAESSRDILHSYRLPFRDGRIYFVDPWLGQYLNTHWIAIGLVIALIVLLYLNRGRLERSV